MEHIRWDGKEHAQTIAAALIQYITEEERDKARRIAYGDLARILKDNHGRGNHGWCTSEWDVSENCCGVVVEICDLHKEYEMTWNKAAKVIHEYITKADSDPLL